MSNKITAEEAGCWLDGGVRLANGGNMDTEYVQAWLCTGEPFNGYVYDQKIALDKFALGCDIESVTIVRHPNGAREYLPGTIASRVKAYREKP